MVLTEKKINSVIPNYCPICGADLNYINALDTKAKCFLVYCKICKWCREYKICPNCGEFVCL